jgi:hypothetical protein
MVARIYLRFVLLVSHMGFYYMSLGTYRTLLISVVIDVSIRVCKCLSALLHHSNCYSICAPHYQLHHTHHNHYPILCGLTIRVDIFFYCSLPYVSGTIAMPYLLSLRHAFSLNFQPLCLNKSSYCFGYKKSGTIGMPL